MLVHSDAVRTERDDGGPTSGRYGHVVVNSNIGELGEVPQRFWHRRQLVLVTI
jgi:hypothetical protein